MADAQPAAKAQPSFFARIFTTAPRGQWAVDSKQQKEKPNEFIVMRWNLLFLIFCFIIIPLPLWIDIFSPMFEQVYTICVGWIGAILLTICSIRSLFAMRWMGQVVDKNWEELYPRNTPEERERADQLQHLVMMCGYKEPMVVIQASVDSLASNTQAKRLFVVIGLEEGTPDVAEKAEALKKRYQDSFKKFTVTRHPKQWAGDREIRGKCSNANYTMRAAVSRLEEFGQLNLEATTATSCDTDSIFAPRYFENLGYQFLTYPRAKEVVWQAPLFYNHQLAARPFFVRGIALLRGAFMLGFLIPYSINTMSIFSFSLDLCIKGEFFHAHYQMDDIIYTLTCMQALQKRVKILMIPVPVISGPTSGVGYCDEISEWWRQSERWTIGACEVFHYFMVKRRRYNCAAAWSYGSWFVCYYGFILCSLTLTGVMGFVNFALDHAKDGVRMDLGVHRLTPTQEVITRWVALSSLFWTYLIFATFFIIDKLAVRLVEHLGMKKVGEERTNILQDFKDWILMWPSLVMYSIVSYYAILKVAILGKKVCGHDPSSKEGLGAGLNAPAEEGQQLPTLLTGAPGAAAEAKQQHVAI